MKKLYPYADCLVALCGLGGALLRQQMLSGGVDEKGLNPASAAWSALLVLTALVLVGIWLLSHKNVPQPKRPAAFQAVGALCAAAGLLHFGISQLSSTLPAMKIAAILALGGGVSMAVFAVFLLLGKKGWSLTHLIPCVVFALLLFLEALDASREAEFSRYILQLLAFAAAAVSFFWQLGFDVGSGNGKKAQFWRLAALYLCLIAAPGSYALLFTATALYQLLGCRVSGETAL